MPPGSRTGERAAAGETRNNPLWEPFRNQTSWLLREKLDGLDVSVFLVLPQIPIPFLLELVTRRQTQMAGKQRDAGISNLEVERDEES